MEFGTSMDKTIDIPASKPYPKILSFDQVKQLQNKFCYVIKGYPHRGIGFLVVRQEGNVCIRLSDFDGNLLDPEDLKDYKKSVDTIMTEYSSKIILTMQLIRIPRAMFYIACCDIPRVVDIQFTLNKFCGPGWLIDFIGKQDIPIQEKIGNPILLDKENIAKIINKQDDYGHGDFIFKPSVFKPMVWGEDVIPMYGRIKNLFNIENPRYGNKYDKAPNGV